MAAARCRATRRAARWRRHEHAARRLGGPPQGGARPCRDRAAGAGHRGHRLVQLPGPVVDGRAGAVLQPRERRPARVDQGLGHCKPAEPDRRRDLHAVGQRLRPEGGGARELLPPAVPERVQAGGRGLDRHAPAEESRRAADPVRDAQVPARGQRRGGAPRGQGDGLGRAGQHQQPAGRQLHARGRPVRLVAVLRRAQHPAAHAWRGDVSASPARTTFALPSGTL